MLCEFTWFVNSLILIKLLGRAIHNQDAINRYAQSQGELVDCQVSPADWEALGHVREWLSDFRAATTMMSTTSKPMLSQTHHIFRGLEKSVQGTIANLSPDANGTLKTALIDAHTKLSDYYYKFDVSPYYLWAAHMFLARN